MSYTSGWLEKKSGGKEGQSAIHKLSEKWAKRFFVLCGTELRYYKTDDEYNKGKAALGSIECTGASFRLKGTVGNAFRFDVITHTRELRLRGPSSAFHMWQDALAPYCVGEHEDPVPSSPDEGRMRSYTEGDGNPSEAVASGPVVASGWLEKKSGGKEGLKQKSGLFEKWTRRWFVLVGTELRYYRSDADCDRRKEWSDEALRIFHLLS